MKSTHSTARAYGKSALTMLVMVTGTAALMAACTTTPIPRTYDQDKLSEAIRVPAGNVIALETTAVGTLNYECRANTPAPGTTGWFLVSPTAALYDRSGLQIGNYSGPPATWRLTDGSSVVGTQVAVAPVIGDVHLPLQLSTGARSAAPGMLQDITYIQRVNTKNGRQFASPCTQSEIGKQVTLPYQADYIFWKAS